MSSVHVIGAGLAGLSCAVRIDAAGLNVTVHEAAGYAGGRCRSYLDSKLDRRIDNGNHLLLSGNRSALAYLSEIGAADSLVAPEGAGVAGAPPALKIGGTPPCVPPGFAFLDLENGGRWTVPAGLSCLLRVPGGRFRDYLDGFRLSRAGPGATVAGILDVEAPVFRNFWEPLCVGVLNISAEEGAASLMAAVLGETLGLGAAACSPRVVREGLSESFILPALKKLENKVLFNHRLKSIELSVDKAASLDFGGGDNVVLGDGDHVVLAVPPLTAADLIPGLEAPRGSRAIVNAHFLMEEKRSSVSAGVSLLGLVGGVSHWLFVRGGIASVTISAADHLAGESNEVLAGRLWPEVAMALGLGGAPMPPVRIVKEKRATFAQTPEEIMRRPGPVTKWRNLLLAGDWTNTGLPATIEGAIRSGQNAAAEIISG